MPKAQSRRLDRGYAEHPAVIALHPGPGSDYRPPEARRLTDREMLAEIERELLDMAISRHVHGSGQLGHLARRAIVLRAALGGEVSK